MLKMKWAAICLLGVFSLSTAAQADFTLTDPGVTGSGSGNSTGTAVIENGNDFSAPHYGYFERQDVTLGTVANSFQGSFVEAYDGTASVSTSANFTDIQNVNGDTVTTNVNGSTSASAQRDDVGEADSNEGFAVLSAAGGTGAVANDVTTETGLITALSETYAYSSGSDDPDASVDTTVSAKGSAGVLYRFAGSPGPETASVSDVDITASADIANDAQGGSYAESVGWALSLMSWTDNPTLGQIFNAQVGINSETEVENYDIEDEEDLDAQASTAANTALNFNYRPIAAPTFSFVGNAGGTVEAQSFIDSPNEEGDAYADAGKHAIGRAGSSTDYPALSAAWLTADVWLNSYDDEFTGSAQSAAVNPAVLGDGQADPDPSMTVNTQYGTYAAAMGSSSQTNSRVEAAVALDQLEQGADDPEEDDEAFASAFGFAIAAQDLTSYANLGPQQLLSLSTESAFVGFGAVTAGDEDQSTDQDSPFSATANAYNLYGTASSPTYSGLINNGDASASILEDENGVYQRASSASADYVSGTNYPVAIALNQSDGTIQYSNTPWWWGFYADEMPWPAGTTDYDHLAGAFIGAGGN